MAIDESITAKLRALSERHGTTLFMTVLAGWAVVLGRLANQRDVVIGTPTAGRTRTELEGLIGLFINTLALRIDLAGPLTVSDHTEVLMSEPPSYLKLRARARPLGTAIVKLHLRPEGPSTTRVVMEEVAGDPFTKVLGFNPITDRLVKARNVESLRRLKSMAEGHGPSMEQAAA